MQASKIRKSQGGPGPANATISQQLKRNNNKPPPTGGKLMRLRCRFRTLHDSYLTKSGTIDEKDADVTFVTMDGQNILGHKIILCSASTLFSSVFADQNCEEMTYVLIPDVRAETMRLILQLAYTESINVTMKQIKEVGSFLSLFGMEWKQFNFDGFDESAVHSNASSNSSVSIAPLMRQQKPPLMKFGSMTSKASNQAYFSNNQAYSNISGHPGVEGQNESDSQDSDDFTFKLQGYDEVVSGNQNDASRLKQQLTSPMAKPSLTMGRNSANFELRKRISENSPMSQNANFGSRIEMGNDGSENNDTDFGSINSKDEDAQKLIKEWMAKVGQEEDSTPVKKLRLALSMSRRDKEPVRAPTPPLAVNQPVNTCTVCSMQFNDRNVWKWHEERHVGMGIFKCGHCNLLFGTSKKMIQHEQTEHGLSVSSEIANSAADMEESESPDSADPGRGRKRKLIPRQDFPETNPEKPVVPRLTLIKSSNKHGTQYKPVVSSMKTNLNLIKGKSLTASHKNVNAASRIGIGHSVGTEQMDANKVKQLHWLYNCLKCDSCSDKLSKAMSHYSDCYPDKELPFEKTVVKYRQGFYGKYRCPVCPRRYTSVGGFVIHCGHMHPQYRKTFSQTNEGVLKCVDCKVDYSLPSEFNDHLKDGKCQSDGGSPNASLTQPSGGNESSNKKARIPKLTVNNARREYENPYDDMLAKRRSQTYIGRSPRSARLANRIINETLAKNPDNVDETNFSSISCPVCGADSITDINLHLATDHSELGIEVQRVSEDLLRCRRCKLTFTINDVFSHASSCTGSKEFEFVSQRRAAAKNKQSSPTKTEVRTLIIPEGVGSSAVDTIDFKNLNSPATLAAALKCSVCGKVARKLGIISECLKSHGIIRCALCFNTYMNKLDYTTHLKQCHGQGNAGGKLNCPICLKVHVNAGQVVSHMFKTHWLAILRETKNLDTYFENKEIKSREQTSDHQPKDTTSANLSVAEISLNSSETNEHVAVSVPENEGPLKTVVNTNTNDLNSTEDNMDISQSEKSAPADTEASKILLPVLERNDTSVNEDNSANKEDDKAQKNYLSKEAGNLLTKANESANKQ